MALDAFVAFTNTNNVAFPDTEGVNASGPLTIDGTEFVKAMIDNYMFGPQQALLNYAGLIPNGLSEEDGNSQELEAMQKSFGHPGESVDWYGQSDPASIGLRLLLLNGQGVLVSNYADLTTAVYVGDGNNGAAESFYRADDAGGTIRNIGGNYLILPDARGRFKRALDTTGLIDPDGASRLTGDSQEDAFQGHWHQVYIFGNPGSELITGSDGTASSLENTRVKDAVTDTVNGTPRTAIETRSKNISVQAAIRY